MNKTLGQLWLHPGDVTVMEALLFLTITFVICLLGYMQVKRDSVDLRWLIYDEKKRPSIHKIGQIVALVVSSWGFIALTLKGQLTESYFTGYMVVWSGSVALDKYLSRRTEDKRATVIAKALEPPKG